MKDKHILILFYVLTLYFSLLINYVAFKEILFNVSKDYLYNFLFLVFIINLIIFTSIFTFIYTIEKKEFSIEDTIIKDIQTLLEILSEFMDKPKRKTQKDIKKKVIDKAIVEKLNAKEFNYFPELELIFNYFPELELIDDDEIIEL